jgi:hypothetical protein
MGTYIVLPPFILYINFFKKIWKAAIVKENPLIPVAISLVLEARHVCKGLLANPKESADVMCGQDDLAGSQATKYKGWAKLTKACFELKISFLFSIESISVEHIFVFGNLAASLLQILPIQKKKEEDHLTPVAVPVGCLKNVPQGLTASAAFHTAFLPRRFRNSFNSTVQLIFPYPANMENHRLAPPSLINIQPCTVSFLASTVAMYLVQNPLIRFLDLNSDGMEAAFQYLRLESHGRYWTNGIISFNSLINLKMTIPSMWSKLFPQKDSTALALVSSSDISSSSMDSNDKAASESSGNEEVIEEACYCGLLGHVRSSSEDCLLHKDKSGNYVNPIYLAHYADSKMAQILMYSIFF